MGEHRHNWSSELRAMIALALPVVLSELGWVAQGVVDNIMVGQLGPVAETLASLEGLDAHARAVTLRLGAMDAGA